MTPGYRLMANDADITDLIRLYFIGLDVKDSAGIESDTLSISLSDTGVIAWPPKGAVLKFWFGYEGDLVFKGQFVVDEVDHSGPPDMITIHAKATDMLGLGRTQKSRSWSGYTISRIVEVMAQEQGLIAGVSAPFRETVQANLVQLNESDLHFLTRLGRQVGAIAKAKGGRLLFVEQGVARTAGGNEMPLIKIPRSDCSSHSYQERGRDEFDRVAASYCSWVTYTYTYPSWYQRYYAGYRGTFTYRRKQVKRIYVGPPGRTKYLSGYFQSAALAKQAAIAELNRMGREESTLSLDLSQGDPRLMAEVRLEVSGFRERISELDWVIADVSHSLSSSGGLSSSINAVRTAAYTAE